MILSHNITVLNMGKWMEIKDTITYDVDRLKLKKINICYSEDMNDEPIFVIGQKGKTLTIKTIGEIKAKIK